MKGALESRSGRHVLRFERTLAHPPEKVWHVLVDEGELAYWFPARIEGAREPGAPLRFAWRGAGRGLPVDAELAAKIASQQRDVPDEVMRGEMRIVDPPRTLEFTWHDEVLRFELSPVDGGTRLVFTHTFDDASIAAGAAAGWHVSLEALEHRVAGRVEITTAAALAALESDYRALFEAR